MNKLKKTFVALSIFSVSVTGSLLIAKDNRNEVTVQSSKMIKTSNSNKKIKQISNGNSISSMMVLAIVYLFEVKTIQVYLLQLIHR